MLTTRELQDEILRLKKEKNICILVHAYQSHDIWEIADYVGDSYGLSVEAAKTDADTVIMCGVRFMAETVKMLSPEKKVLLANPIAGCPMADQYSGSDLRELKKDYPGYAVVAYINTTSDTKTEADVCVTSSSALKIVKNMPEQDILFMPDPNLGAWVRDMCPEKNIALIKGGCPTHLRVTKLEAELAKKEHPEALLLVHPECLPAVVNLADQALSRREVDKLGLDALDRRMLRSIITYYGGGPVGLETLAATINEEAVTLEDMCEPFLMQLGFLARTPRGRCATKLAYEHLGFASPDDGENGKQLSF